MDESAAVPSTIFSKIWEENMGFLFDKNIFDKDNFSFVWSIVSMEKNADAVSSLLFVLSNYLIR